MGRASRRTRSWTPDDATGGPVDEVIARVRHAVPGLIVERLAATHAGDDDNVYFVGDASVPGRVQLDTGPAGRPPFVVEADDRVVTSGIAEAVAVVVAWLDSSDVLMGDALP